MIATADSCNALSGTEVERLFRKQRSPLRLFPGGAVAVYWRGQFVLDLVGGDADTQ
jgi:hypothetical protein